MFALAAMGLASLPGLTESTDVEAQAAAAGVLLLAAPWCLGGGFLAWAFFMTWSQGLLVMREHGLAARAVRESKTNEKADDGLSSTTA